MKAALRAYKQYFVIYTTLNFGDVLIGKDSVESLFTFQRNILQNFVKCMELFKYFFEVIQGNALEDTTSIFSLLVIPKLKGLCRSTFMFLKN